MNSSAWTLHFSFAWRVTFLYFLPPFDTSLIWWHLRKLSWSEGLSSQMGAGAPGGCWLSLSYWFYFPASQWHWHCVPLWRQVFAMHRGSGTARLCVGWDGPGSDTPAPPAAWASPQMPVWWVQAQVWAGSWCRGGYICIYLHIHKMFSLAYFIIHHARGNRLHETAACYLWSVRVASPGTLICSRFMEIARRKPTATHLGYATLSGEFPVFWLDLSVL